MTLSAATFERHTRHGKAWQGNARQVRALCRESAMESDLGAMDARRSCAGTYSSWLTKVKGASLQGLETRLRRGRESEMVFEHDEEIFHHRFQYAALFLCTKRESEDGFTSHPLQGHLHLFLFVIGHLYPFENKS